MRTAVSQRRLCACHRSYIHPRPAFRRLAESAGQSRAGVRHRRIHAKRQELRRRLVRTVERDIQTCHDVGPQIQVSYPLSRNAISTNGNALPRGTISHIAPVGLPVTPPPSARPARSLVQWAVANNSFPPPALKPPRIQHHCDGSLHFLGRTDIDSPSPSPSRVPSSPASRHQEKNGDRPRPFTSWARFLRGQSLAELDRWKSGSRLRLRGDSGDRLLVRPSI
jgi:hypothetical protein